MESDSLIGVPVLTEEDSRTLFRQKAGDVVDFTIPETFSTGIVGECKGLPLAIVTLGLALKNNNEVAVWEDALTQLKKSIYDGFSRVVSSIRLSYDFLQNETIKICFLFCCIFPEDYKIGTDVLLRYLVGENLLKNVDSMVESRGRLQSLVSKLVSSNLLLRDEDGCVMMHDMVRDVAIHIASEDEKLGFIVKAGMGLRSWPNVKLNNCKRLSVMNNNLRLRYDIPYKLEAPQLLTLSMGGNVGLKEIPNDFFDNMENLLTLDLSGSGIRSFPSSLALLVNLRTLLVERCFLHDICPIEELEKLEILSFRKSMIKRWPIHTGKLSNMKSLDLSDSWGEKIPAKVIASMSRLEDLSMLTGRGNLFITNEIFEVTSSTLLTSLELHLSYSNLATDIPILEKLIRFIVCVSYANNSVSYRFRPASRRFQRNLYLVIPVEMLQPAKWVSVLVTRTECLYLQYSNGLEDVEQLDGTGMNNLKFLSINNLRKMKYLVNSRAEKAPKCAFRSLEELHISSSENFKAFCRGGFADGFFCKLRILEVRSCSGVIHLIPADLLPMFPNLEQIVIVDCTGLKQLIQFGEGWIATNTISNNSTTTSITHCPNSPIFPNLKVLHVAFCSQLEYVFQLRVTRGLLQLRELHVTFCGKIKTVIGSGISDATSNAERDKLVLSRLKILLLKGLEELSALSPPGFIVDCPCLVELHVIDCWRLERLPFTSEGVPKLRLLDAQQAWFDALQWDDEGAKPRLHEVFKKTCPDEEPEATKMPDFEESQWKLA